MRTSQESSAARMQNSLGLRRRSSGCADDVSRTAPCRDDSAHGSPDLLADASVMQPVRDPIPGISRPFNGNRGGFQLICPLRLFAFPFPGSRFLQRPSSRRWIPAPTTKAALTHGTSKSFSSLPPPTQRATAVSQPRVAFPCSRAFCASRWPFWPSHARKRGRLSCRSACDISFHGSLPATAASSVNAY